MVPSSDEAVPALRPCGAIASAVALGITKPMPDMNTNSGTTIPANPPAPVAVAITSTRPAAACTMLAAWRIASALIRCTSRALICEPPMMPNALMPNSQPKCSGVMP